MPPRPIERGPQPDARRGKAGRNG